MKWTNKGNEFDDYRRMFESRNGILIYGAGLRGAQVYDDLKNLDIVDGFVDRDIEKQKNGWHHGNVVYAPSVLREGKYFIITAIREEHQKQLDEIHQTLNAMGLVHGVDYIDYTEIGDKGSFFQMYWLFAKNKAIVSSINFIPSTVCNLVCEKCLDFTPLLNKNKRHVIKSLETMKAEIDLFFQWVDYIPRLQISGGEPLLYPDIVSLIAYIGENYRCRIGERFEIVLNGTIVPNEIQCLTLKKYDVLCVVDDYTEQVKQARKTRQQIFSVLEKYKIRYEDNKVDFWFDLEVDITDNSDKSEEEMVEYFQNCAMPFRSNHNGKIYICPFSNFAMKAGIIEDSDDDCFDLHQEITTQSKRAFVEFMLGYSELGYAHLCRRCKGWHTINDSRIPIAVQLENND